MNNSGTIKVKGLCYEDLVAILTTNGYDVEIKASATSNAVSNEYEIKYTPHDYVSNCVTF